MTSVCGASLCLQVGLLGDAEPVLLINHHQSRLAKLHIRLNQRLSPDHQVNGSVTNLLQQFGAFFPFTRPVSKAQRIPMPDIRSQQL